MGTATATPAYLCKGALNKLGHGFKIGSLYNWLMLDISTSKSISLSS